MAPRSGYHESLAELAAVFAFGIAKNHAFLDGNKRAAFYALAPATFAVSGLRQARDESS